MLNRETVYTSCMSSIPQPLPPLLPCFCLVLLPFWHQSNLLLSLRAPEDLRKSLTIMCFRCVWKWDVHCLCVFRAAKLGGQTPKTYEDFEIVMVILAGREPGHEIKTAIESIELVEEVSSEDNITRDTGKNMKNGAKRAVVTIFLQATIADLHLLTVEFGE